MAARLGTASAIMWLAIVATVGATPPANGQPPGSPGLTAYAPTSFFQLRRGLAVALRAKADEASASPPESQRGLKPGGAVPDRPRAAWDSLPVPGGTAALLQAAGLDTAVPRTIALRNVIRAIYEAPPGTDKALDARRERLLEYLRAVSAFEMAAASLNGTAPPLERANASRNARADLEGLAEVLGCELTRAQRKYLLEPGPGTVATRRRELLRIAGFNVEAFLTDANAGRPGQLVLPSDSVPLPLSAARWQSIAGAPKGYAGSLLTALLGQRPIALLYFGLLGVDNETRSFLAGQPGLLHDLSTEKRAAVFASHASSLRVVGGRAVVPGGSDAELAWEGLVGEPCDRPERFFAEVLSRDAGRLALFYHSLAFLDAPRQAFALGAAGASPPDPSDRVERFRKLYSASAQALTGWDPVRWPFARNRFDLAHLMVMTPVGADGRLGPLSSQRFWDAAFRSDVIPDDAAHELRAIDGNDSMDAADMIGALAGPPTRWARGPAWAFVHRVFRRIEPGSWPDALVVARGYRRYRILLSMLERLDITDPGAYAAAIMHAERLARVADRRRATVAVALFQGSLVLVERARLGRVLDAEAATALVRSLSAIPLSEDGEYAGGVTEWLLASYLPAVDRGQPGTPTAADALPIESRVLASMSGRRLTPDDSRHLEITLEGLSYTVDPAAAEYARLRAIRRRQRNLPLDAVVTFTHEVTSLRGGDLKPAGLPERASRIEQAFRDATGAARIRPSRWFDPPTATQAVTQAASGLRRITRTEDLGKLDPIVRTLLAIGDACLAQVLVSLAYAPHLGDPDGTVLMAGDPSVRHDWGLDDFESLQAVPNAWRLPEEDRGDAGWHMAGALLGFDLALGSQALRRVASDVVPGPPTISDVDLQVLTDAASSAVSFDHTDRDLATLVGAIQRGRSRLAEVRAHPDGWAALADAAQIRDVRRALLVWTLANEAERLADLIGLSDLWRLGLQPDETVEHLPAWGLSGRVFDGRWALQFPTVPWIELAQGRRGVFVVATVIPDLVLAVAEALHSRALPAALARPVLSAAAQDFADELQQAYEDDWCAMMALAPTLGLRIDDYVAAITVRGPLVPRARQP